VAGEFIRVGLLEDEARYGLVTAIEVFEHLPDPIAAAMAIGRSLKPGGLLAMTTEVHQPAHLDPDWWYLAPGAGHISLYTTPALAALAARTGFHVLYTTPTNHYWIKGPLSARRLLGLKARLHGARALDKLARRLRGEP
jgi:SAM-dependent methyltransferase